MLAEAHQYTNFSCFTVLNYKFSSISYIEFHKLWKVLKEGQTGRKTTNQQFRDPSAKKFETTRCKKIT